MAHKVHPKIFRIKETKDWLSRWFERSAYQEALRRDFLIRRYLSKKLKDALVESVEIERSPGRTLVVINSARPGLVIGRGGSGIEELRKNLIELLAKGGENPFGQRRADVRKGRREKRELRIEIREIRNPWSSSALCAQLIAQQIEKRLPFRRVMKQILSKITANKEVQGAKIEISGRLGGAEIARRETLKTGRLPLQTLRSLIDYALVEAKTKYGIIGVKVWIYKGEKLD